MTALPVTIPIPTQNYAGIKHQNQRHTGNTLAGHMITDKI